MRLSDIHHEHWARPADHPAYRRVAATAKALNEQRERWLNPPEWLEPLAASVDAADDFADVPAAARPLLRQAAIMAEAAKDARLNNDVRLVALRAGARTCHPSSRGGGVGGAAGEMLLRSGDLSRRKAPW
jgi:hypothetical protein